jgi:hypothetical protein
MEWITVNSVIKCDHAGVIENVNRQDWVRIEVPVLVDDDPEGRDIDWCPNSGPNIKKCGKTLKVHVGYSTWIRIDGHAVVLSNLDGLTDGTVPGTIHYKVEDPKQEFVRADA